MKIQGANQETLDMFKKLKEGLLKQDNRSTRNPIFSVLDHRVVSTTEDEAMGREIIFDMDYESAIYLWKPFLKKGYSNHNVGMAENDNFRKELKEFFLSYYGEEIDTSGIKGIDDIEDFLDDLMEGKDERCFEIINVKYEPRQWDAFFLLEEEAEKYIKTKKHDMVYPYTYAYSSDVYTNSSIEFLRQFILNLDI